jgi:hypothetical protein
MPAHPKSAPPPEQTQFRRFAVATRRKPVQLRSVPIVPWRKSCVPFRSTGKRLPHSCSALNSSGLITNRGIVLLHHAEEHDDADERVKIELLVEEQQRCKSAYDG